MFSFFRYCSNNTARFHANGGSPAHFIVVIIAIFYCYFVNGWHHMQPDTEERAAAGYESMVESIPLAAWERNCSEDWHGYLVRL